MPTTAVKPAPKEKRVSTISGNPKTAQLEGVARALLATGGDTREWATAVVRAMRSLTEASEVAMLVRSGSRIEVFGDPVAALLLRRAADGGTARPSEAGVGDVWQARSALADDDAGWPEPATCESPDSFGTVVYDEGSSASAGLCCWFAEAPPRRRAQVVRTLLAILRPVVEAGARQRQASRERPSPTPQSGLLPMQLLDALEEGAVLCTRAGVTLATNAALAEMLRGEPDAARLQRELSMLATMAPPWSMSKLEQAPDVVTARCRYRLRRWVLPVMLSSMRHDGVLILVTQVHRTPVSWSLLQRRYRLTPRECEVLSLLHEGKSNGEIARALKISPYTARHHTEHVLRKLGISARTQIYTALAALSATPERPTSVGETVVPLPRTDEQVPPAPMRRRRSSGGWPVERPSDGLR